mgnify:FL=1
MLETTWYFTKKMSTVSGHPIMAHFLMVGAKGSVHHAGRNSIGPGPQANVCCALCHYLCIEKRIPSVWQIHPIPIMKREEKQRSTILRKRERKIIIMRHLDDFKRIFPWKIMHKIRFWEDRQKMCVSKPIFMAKNKLNILMLDNFWKSPKMSQLFRQI